MKESRATVAGSVAATNGRMQLRVSGSYEVLDLVPESPSQRASLAAGKSVVVTGAIPEAQKGKSPDSIVYTSVAEEATR